MTLRFKILLGYVVIALTVVLVAFVGLYATHQVGRQYDDAINRTQPVLQSLQDIRFAAVTLAGEAWRDVASRKPRRPDGPRAGAIDEGLLRLDAAQARYQALVAAYFPDERDDAHEIGERIGELKEALEHPEKLTPALDALLSATDDAAEGEQGEFAEYQSGVDSWVSTLERAVAGLGLVALALTILGGLVLSRRISQPVLELRDSALRLGGGHLDTRVAVRDRSEIGQLAGAFNTMAEQLERGMVSRDYLEGIIDSMAEGVVVVDRQGRVERVNRAFVALRKRQDDCGLAGRHVDEFFPTARILDMVGIATSTGVWVETELLGGEAGKIAVALSIANLHDGSGGDKGMVVLVQDITERKRSEERLSYLARYDALTGLPNRTLLMDYLGQELARQPWKKELTAVLFCDLDRFKFVNDTLGHGVGDLLLQRVAERLKSFVRPGDVVARWSGDEFVIMLSDVARTEDVLPLADKVVGHLGAPIQIGAHELYVTVSVGVALAPMHADNADDLVKCADMAMYAAKADGKNTYRLYTEGMAERSQERLALEQSLRHALAEGDQLRVHYQAQKRLDGKLIGFEALVRWHHPELGLISPANFLPAAESAGLMASIDEAVLRIACRQAAQWRADGLGDLRIGVNVSDHLFRRGDLPELVRAMLAEYHLPASAIELELTEAIVMTDIESSIRTMNSLRALGVELSIDDFGTGYSSLSHLKRCPIQTLKIDRSFVNDVIVDPNDAAITEAITALAHKMGIQVIAEGVETEDQLGALRRYGCDAMQGYLLSRPIPAEQIGDFLASQGIRSAISAAA